MSSPAKPRPERFAVYVAGEITQGELARVLRDAGLHMHTEVGHRLVIDRVPGILRRDPPETNVVRMPARLRAGGKK